MTEILATLVPALALALLHFLWQGLLIGIVSWLALAMLRNARPQARYAVSCGALLACVALPAWRVARALFDGGATGFGEPFMPAAAPSPPNACVRFHAGSSTHANRATQATA